VSTVQTAGSQALDNFIVILCTAGATPSAGPQASNFKVKEGITLAGDMGWKAAVLRELLSKLAASLQATWVSSAASPLRSKQTHLYTGAQATKKRDQ
jgi:hypothetical protein